MILRVVVFSMLVLGFFGCGAVAWVMLAAPPIAAGTAPAPQAKVVILTAAHSIRAGLLIKPEDLAPLETITSDVPAGATKDTPQGRGALTGAMIRRSLGEGQTILPADVVHPGDHGFLAAVLGPNMRAITVAVDAVSGTAGLIWPGDRVDVILTQLLDDPRFTAGHRVAAETVLNNSRVIAVDQQIVQGQAPDGTVPPANRTATLEVTAAQAERVLVAGHLGKLSLSVLAADRLENAAQNASSTLPVLPLGPLVSSTAKLPSRSGPLTSRQPGDVTWGTDVSPALGSGEARSAPVRVQVFQGGSDGKEFHF